MNLILGFCFPPPDVPNTFPIALPDMPNNQYSLGFVLNFVCVPGFINTGSSSATCGDRQWIVGDLGAPNCEGEQLFKVFIELRG